MGVLGVAPTVFARRTAWLRGREFADAFRRVQVPARVWFGERDHLVNLRAQRAVFQQISRGKPDWTVVDVPDAGHVALPTPVVEHLAHAVADWLAP